MRELAVHHRHGDLRLVDVLRRDVESILLEHDEVGEFPDLYRADLALHTQVIGAAHLRGFERRIQRNHLVERRELRAVRFVQQPNDELTKEVGALTQLTSA